MITYTSFYCGDDVIAYTTWKY